MTLDVPDEVRSTALARGHAAWLDGLPSVLDSLAKDWSLTTGATMRGGHAALVVEATLAGGGPAVLKVGFRDIDSASKRPCSISMRGGATHA